MSISLYLWGLCWERTPAFMVYLKNRGTQDVLYQRQVSDRQQLEKDDHVLLPIPRVDRSSTCPKNIEAKVFEVLPGNFVRLGINDGKISAPFQQEQLTKVTGAKRKITVPDTEILLTKAYRSSTSYNKQSLCACKKGCSSYRCKCFKGGLKCSSKCHQGGVCDNSK